MRLVFTESSTHNNGNGDGAGTRSVPNGNIEKLPHLEVWAEACNMDDCFAGAMAKKGGVVKGTLDCQ